MKPKPQPRDSFELFQAHFDQLLDPGHELIQLARQIDWAHLDAVFVVLFQNRTQFRHKTAISAGWEQD